MIGSGLKREHSVLTVGSCMHRCFRLIFKHVVAINTIRLLICLLFPPSELSFVRLFYDLLARSSVLQFFRSMQRCRR